MCAQYFKTNESILKTNYVCIEISNMKRKKWEILLIFNRHGRACYEAFAVCNDVHVPSSEIAYVR